MQDHETSRRILSIAREILASDGLDGVSFDAIARRFGHSKQAVLYWFPTKRDLLAAMFLPWLEAETRVAEDALAKTTGRPAAIKQFVHALAAFHFDDLDRFRMMYLAPQVAGRKSSGRRTAITVEAVHPVTNRLYGALAVHLDAAPEIARRQAVAIHSAVLGLVMMFALADSLLDPLKHSRSDMIDALVASLTTS